MPIQLIVVVPLRHISDILNVLYGRCLYKYGFRSVLLQVGAERSFNDRKSTKTDNILRLFPPNDRINFLLSSEKISNCFLKYCFITESWIERCLSESENKRYSSHTSLGNMSNDERKQEKHFNWANCGSAHVYVCTEVQSVKSKCLCLSCALIICFGRLLQRRKKKITEPLNLIRHQPLWNGKLSRTNVIFFIFCHVLKCKRETGVD